ncbi:RNase P subunit p30-domain-containing protein [Dioszegia hungarica]|uniref:RNase P subunit p30-domain-containing protein n=1 Tax=Dioszegia hungarica TaxID=4972 RepID=A0AA38HE59_9TREE|nr:RNase P subunit p30-domain-containing protein [Dioszegia hungarica]KAI9638347.1 RNase P subunit p30-domain-containing protein [Dioszegia hungarica]
MYFDLFVPFPLAETAENQNKGKGKGKGKAPPPPAVLPTSCWTGVEPEDKEAFAKRVGLAGHLGFNVIAPTVVRDPEAHACPSPFVTLPFPHLDPRHPGESSRTGESSMAGPSRSQVLVQVTRYHVKLEDARTNPIVGANTDVFRNYDIISCQPTNDKALQLACTDLSNPGPNQLSIITLPLHERPYHFRLNRKQIKQAQRNGVVVGLVIPLAGLIILATSIPLTIFHFQMHKTARRYRQNWMSNAREIVRITGGKGVIISSGPGGGPASVRGPADLVNLATTLGMPANVAKDCLSLNGKMVLLRAQARRTYKAVLSMPEIIPPPGVPRLPATEEASLKNPNHTAERYVAPVEASKDAGSVGSKRAGEAGEEGKPVKKKYMADKRAKKGVPVGPT